MESVLAKADDEIGDLGMEVTDSWGVNRSGFLFLTECGVAVFVKIVEVWFEGVFGGSHGGRKVGKA